MAVGPDVIVLVVRVSTAAQVEPLVAVAGMVGNEIHDEVQSCRRKRSWRGERLPSPPV